MEPSLRTQMKMASGCFAGVDWELYEKYRELSKLTEKQLQSMVASGEL